MPVQQKWTINTKPIEDLSHFIDSLDQITYDLFAQTTAEIEPLMLDELRAYPPVPAGSKYVRTFRLRDGWRIEIAQAGSGQFIFRVTNDVEYTQFVVGSLALANAASARFQRDFHKANGWQLASPTITFWFEAFLEEFQERFLRELGQFGTITGSSRRAFTNR